MQMHPFFMLKLHLEETKKRWAIIQFVTSLFSLPSLSMWFMNVTSPACSFAVDLK